MSNVPQPQSSGNPASRSRNPSPWIDLIAFLAILTLGGVLIAFGRVTAGSLATICAALGGLYGAWKRLRSSDEVSSTDKPDSELRKHPR
jgi:hypothetical protein